MIIQPVTEGAREPMARRDQLLMAGSKVSLKAIYDRQMNLPTHRFGKFHKVEDVEDLFILMNGVLTDMATHNHRTNKLLQDARTENQSLQAQLDDQTKALTEAEAASESNAELVHQLKSMGETLGAQAVVLADKQAEIDQLMEANRQLVAYIRQLEA